MRLLRPVLCALSLASVLSSPAGVAGQAPTAPTAIAFFYQTVSPEAAIVRAGATSDGTNVRTHDVNLVYANRGPSSPSVGDPVFSRLENGRWAMAAWKRTATAGASSLAYFEGACPAVNEAEVKIIPASSAPGCRARQSSAMAKTSQVFSVEGSNFLFAMSGGDLYLTRLTDAQAPNASALTAICARESSANSIHDLRAGESTLVLPKNQADNMLLSDTAIARRKDGTWVLFFKGIASGLGCTQGSLCELCARSIYRAVSTDLIHWSSIERVVTQASVPDAATYPDGTVWLYYQNFANACAANDLRLAARAPITGVFELPGGTMSYGFDVRFSHEAFETDTAQHYPTNGNPIALPHDAAYSALNACLGRSPR